MSKYLFILSILLLFSCKEDSLSTDDLLGQMNSVYAEIEDLIVTSCESSDQCVATAIGVKPCGGPTRFIVHSSETDQEKLDELITRYDELNEEYNETSGIGSDCSVVTAPEIDCISGACQEIGS
ncbi:hypothetical protein [Ekhidna sp.]|uniref:hypothetical protein n=1 Tax=Ekhidna sp. TaxID=2608089 RepID=UPI0032EB7DAA